ncbi:MAG: CCA tRNA nucleotidyltransferase [Methanocellales archaeon]|nr:CCA tRNA nucleotidyltransferase [Methanocellales archaeon]
MSRKICSQVLQKIKPSKSEEKALHRLTNRIITQIDAAAKELGVEVRGLLVGSAARNTWISGDRDLDIFITFPESVTHEELESLGLGIAKKVAPKYEERYAEHPYIRAFFEGIPDETSGRVVIPKGFQGYRVDLVPCFRVSDPSAIRSAVDRTPFHNEYVKNKIKGLEDEVRLLKQFLKGIGVYGAELKTMGFSGYLCELLIIKYNSFLDVVQSVSKWHRNVIIDIENHGTLEHDTPLVIIDPVDPSRNVAAAVSLDNFCTFVDASREFLKKPGIHFFFPPPVKPLTDKELAQELKHRKTELLAVVFDTPNVVDDILYPQLYKAVRSIEELLHRNDFRVFRSGIWSGVRSVILLEMEVATLPNVKKHIGPPVESSIHAEKFKIKYASQHPYIQDGRYVVDISREYTKAKDLLKSKLKTCGVGKHVSEAIGKGYRVLKDAQIAKIEDKDFRIFLRKYFRKYRRMRG